MEWVKQSMPGGAFKQLIFFRTNDFGASLGIVLAIDSEALQYSEVTEQLISGVFNNDSCPDKRFWDTVQKLDLSEQLMSRAFQTLKLSRQTNLGRLIPRETGT